MDTKNAGGFFLCDTTFGPEVVGADCVGGVLLIA